MSLLDDLDTIGGRLGQVFEALELGVGDDHAGELCVAAVGAGLGVATETSDLREVKCELVLKPVDGIS